VKFPPLKSGHPLRPVLSIDLHSKAGLQGIWCRLSDLERTSGGSGSKISKSAGRATYCHRYIHMQQHIRPSQSITCHIMMITYDHYVSDHSVIFNVYPCFIVQRLFSTHTHIYIYIYIYNTHSYIYFETGNNMGVITCCRMFGLVANMVRKMQVAVPPVSFLVVNCSDTWPVCFVSSHFLLFHWIPLPMRFLLVNNPITLVLPHRDLKLNAHLSTGLAKRLLYIAPYSPISHHTTSYSTCAS